MGIATNPVEYQTGFVTIFRERYEDNYYFEIICLKCHFHLYTKHVNSKILFDNLPIPNYGLYFDIDSILFS